MSEQHVLVAGGVVGGHVLHEGSRTAAVKEALGDTGAAAVVGGGQAAGKVRSQVDHGAIVGTGGQNAGDGDADVGLGVVANDGGVDHQRQEGLLVGGGVVLEQCRGVVVADGLAGGTTSGGGRASQSQSGSESGGLHLE